MGKPEDHSNQGGGYDRDMDREIERLAAEDQARQDQQAADRSHQDSQR